MTTAVVHNRTFWVSYPLAFTPMQAAPGRLG
jgi:hypothetical protein